MSDFGEVPLLDHAGRLYNKSSNIERVAIVGVEQIERKELLTKMDWQIIVNPMPENGMSFSIKLGLEQVEKSSSHILLIALADMPMIKDNHLNRLCELIQNGAKIAFSKSDERISPPAAFHRDSWHYLHNLHGDMGAKQIIQQLDGVATLELDYNDLEDVNTPNDLERLRDLNGQ